MAYILRCPYLPNLLGYPFGENSSYYAFPVEPAGAALLNFGIFPMTNFGAQKRDEDQREPPGDDAGN